MIKKIAKLFQRRQNLRKQSSLRAVILGFAVLALIPIVFFILKDSKPAAAWFNDNWLYRKSIAITNAGTDQTDFQISFTMDTAALITAGKMQADCDDIRVTDINGKVIPHWIEENNPGCNNAATKIWTKVPSIETSGATIYAYYGNPSVSNVENGNDVFEFFDDFNDGNSQGWTEGDWTGVVSSGGGRTNVYKNQNNASQTLESIAGSVSWSDYVIEMDIYEPSAGDVSNHAGIIFRAQDIANYEVCYFRAHQSDAGSAIACRPVTNGSLGSEEAGVTTIPWDTWFHVKVTVSGTTGEVYVTDMANSAKTFTLDYGTSGSIGVFNHDSYGYQDNIFVRKYTVTEPSVGSPATEEQSPSPVAYWKFDEGEGTDAHDSTGQGNDGTLINSPTWQTEENCISGKCLYFDRSSSNYISNTTGIDIQDDFTYSVWVKSDDASIAATRGILSNHYHPAPCYGVSLAMRSSRFRIFAGDGLDNRPDLYFGPTLESNRWYHVAAIYEDGTFHFFVDGEKVSETWTTTVAQNNTDFVIGRWAPSYGDYYFNGFIDEPKIYPYARTDDQIKTDYIAGSSSKGSGVVVGHQTETAQITPIASDLVTYWKFDEGQGLTAYDSVGGNNGTIYGADWTSEGKVGGALGFSASEESLTLDYTTWEDGQTGSVGSFSRNGDVSENYRVIDTDPWGRKTVVWEARPDSVSGADGGWNHSTFSIDNTKLYRFSVWVNRKVTGNGTFYLGCHGYGSTDGVLRRSNGGNNTNPYFWTGTPSQNVWTLAVGHIWPAGSGTGSQHTDSGRYTISGNKIGSISEDYVWREETTTARHRSYLYYSTNTDTRQQWIYPRVDIVDGTEPSIQDLIDGFDSYGDDVFLETADDKETISFWYDKDSDGTWQHLAKSSGTYYVDGQPGTPDEFPVYISGNEVYLGRTTSSNFVTGTIDEFKIYKTILASEEVLQDYNKGKAVVMGVAGTDSSGNPSFSASAEHCVPGDTATCDPPVGEWNFEEGSGDTVNDKSGNSNTGTWTGTGTHWATGKIGKGGSFNGSDDYITTNNQEILNTGVADGLTISAWIYPRQFTSSTYEAIVLKKTTHDSGGCGYQYGFTGYYNTAQIRFFLDTTGGSLCQGLISSSYLQTNEWSHIVGTYDSTSGAVKIYINGVLDNTGTYSGSIDTDDTYPLQFGKANNAFDGFIDQVMVYNYARTPAQIAWDYNRGKPVAHWKFDECQGTTLHDVSGNDNHGTISIGATIPQSSAGTCADGQSTSAWYNGATGKLNSSLKFDGVDDYVLLPNDLITVGDPFSVSAWVNLNSDTNRIFSLRNDMNYVLRVSGTTVSIYSNNWHNVGSISLSQWQQITTTFDGTTFTTYINGNYSNNYDETPNSASTNNTIGIAGWDLTTAPTNGQIDDTKLFNYALTPVQVKTLYNNGAVHFAN